MPELFESDEENEDLYPADKADHDKLRSRLMDMFSEADDARRPFEERWRRYYKLYRSYISRDKTDWRSKVFIPMVFWTIETITPRLVANLPKFLVHPIGPEDTEPATTMEQILDWCGKQSHLFLELVEAYKAALMFGSGLVKTFYDVVEARRSVTEPVLEPVFADQQVIDPETQAPLLDPDGMPVMEQVQVGEQQAVDSDGQPKVRKRREPYVVYDGPVAEWIDNFDFWPSPGATSMKDARYVIHRVFKDWAHVKKLADEGIYRIPEHIKPGDLLTAEDEPQSTRLTDVELGTGSRADISSRRVELLEFWTDEQVITVAGRKAILRVEDNPFDHGEKPFAQVIDHIVPGEFWGIGEIEPLEGLQDTENTIVNQRLDQGRLLLQAMFAVDITAIEERGDLRIRPGGIIRITQRGVPINQIVQRLDFGGVNPEAFKEAAEIERFSEKVSGVSAYQTGTDSPDLNDTATGVALISEQGNARFALKTALAEMTGLTRIARHFGSIVQQFWTDERVIRMMGPRGAYEWQKFTPDSVNAALDYDIEAASSTQTDTIRRQQSMSLFQLLIGILPPGGKMALIEDVLTVFGKKDIERYLMGAQAEVPMGAAPGPGEPQDFLGALEQGAPPNGQGPPAPPAPPQEQAGPAGPMQAALGIGG